MINRIIERLEESPCTSTELPYRFAPCHMGRKNRGRVRQIRVARNRSKKPGHGWFKTVYYLEGDEDRAVMKFAEVNAEALSGVDFRRNNVLTSGLSRELSQRLREAIL